MMMPAPVLEVSDDIKSLLKDHRSLFLMIQEMNDGVVICNREKHILAFNQNLKKLLELPHKAISQPLNHHISNHTLDQALNTVSETGRSVAEEIIIERGKHQQRQQYFQVNVVPLMVTEGTTVDGFVIIFHDLTAIRRTEKMRRDFVANVSHELRTPLSAIKGYSETLLEGALDDQAVAEDFVEVIFRHSNRLSQLVDDLLDLSKLESPDFNLELNPMRLVTLVEKVASLAANAIEDKNLNFWINIPQDLSVIQADASSLEQVITNLLDNAIKYTPSGGHIEISAFDTYGWAGEELVQVNIKDSGMGIEGKHLNRLFERFYRVDKARSREMGGTGLGLSIVKHIVQSHGGDIWVESELNAGSTFSFTLMRA